MQQHQPVVNTNTIALLTNVSLVMAALERLIKGSRHIEERMICLYGPSGWGKTKAITYAANKHRAIHVRCFDVTTKKSLYVSILKEMGITPAPTMPEMLEQICEELTTSQRPLIIDEVDYLVTKGIIEVVRGIHDGSASSAIIIVGEDKLPSKLIKWERVHRRVREMVMAQPADFCDADQLRSLYAHPSITIADDLLEQIVVIAKGSVSRIIQNIDAIQVEAQANGWSEVDSELWANRPLITGKAPKRGSL